LGGALTEQIDRRFNRSDQIEINLLEYQLSCREL
jgi:hypothetical protein